MSVKLYVGGFPYATTEDALRSHFETIGAVESVAIIKDKMTGRSKGFGFVEMSDEKAADDAINAFNGKDYDGRTLTVNIARPLEPRR